MVVKGTLIRRNGFEAHRYRAVIGPIRCRKNGQMARKATFHMRETKFRPYARVLLCLG